MSDINDSNDHNRLIKMMITTFEIDINDDHDKHNTKSADHNYLIKMMITIFEIVNNDDHDKHNTKFADHK